MRRLIRHWLSMLGIVCAVALAGVFTVPAGAAAQSDHEEIVSDDVTIAINHDASILVTEEIAYDFGGNERHGIIRGIPVLRAYNRDYDQYYPVEVRSVESPDAPAQYTVDNTGSAVTIKIGDPNQTVTGVHSYRLTYLVRSSIDPYANHDELYWNATGDQWNVPIGQAMVRVTAPAAVTGAACWAGPAGSDRECQDHGIVNGEARFTQAGLGPGEGLTVAAALPKGVVASPQPVLKERWSLQRAFALTPVTLGAFGSLLALVAILGAVVLTRGQRRRVPRDQLPPQTAPPGDLRPGQAGTLLDGVANPRDVTATIVDLAVRGYLQIEDTGWDAAPKDWRLIRLDKTGGLLDYEQILLDGLFMNAETDSGTPQVRLSELGTEFAPQLKRAQDALYADVTKRGWFTTRPDQARRMWLLIGAAMFAAGTIAVIILAANTHLGIVPMPLALGGLALISGLRWIPMHTASGAEMARRVAAFREYITTDAAAQAEPAGQPDELYGYLPYAIAFGCTRQWAGLTGRLTLASGGPSWYVTPGNRTVDSLASLTRSSYYFTAMHHFTVAANTWVSTSGTSGSAFSGGGFSGGGGGGGGGGSW